MELANQVMLKVKINVAPENITFSADHEVFGFRNQYLTRTTFICVRHFVLITVQNNLTDYESVQSVHADLPTGKDVHSAS